MSPNHFDLVAASRQEMIAGGFLPGIPADAMNQLQTIEESPAAGEPSGPEPRDLTALLWSSIDNDDSRDLDQIEWAERTATGIRVLVGIADVDALVKKDTPIDRYAEHETTSVYSGIHTYPMLPEKLSTDLTSLNEDEDRAAMVVEFVVTDDGSCAGQSIYRARVRNHAQLAYNSVGAWLEGKAPAPAKVAASSDLQAQLHLQDQAAQKLRAVRFQRGALNFDRIEAQAVVADGKVQDIKSRVTNHATQLIEDFMIAANETMAEALSAAHVSSIRRIVKDPDRWNRIVALAHTLGETLPPTPDSGALNHFLTKRKKADPDRYEDLSLAILKLMGPGEYVLARAGGDAPGHFGLAAHDYTHSTAPNRRFADLVTQRLIKALGAHQPAPYTDEELDAIARDCTTKEDAARKVQRNMLKRMAAVAMQNRIGQTFAGVVTGASQKGVYVRVTNPPVEGRVMLGEEGLDVGDRVRVSLLSADPVRGFIDFARAS
jgi:VacB/RNase II family 3'-5' exoribonuclease